MTAPARLLYVITDSGVGGTEKVLRSLIGGLDKNKFRVTDVLVLKEKREMAAAWEALGARVESFGMRRWPMPGLIRRVAGRIAQAKPDIVHAFLFHSIQVARLAHIGNRSYRLISSPRVNYQFVSRSFLLVDRLLRPLDDAVICESEASRQNLVVNHGYDLHACSVAWNSIDTQQFSFDRGARERLRREWGVAPSEILIGSVGRLHSQKGYDLLIRALKEMTGVKRPFKAAVVGEGPERAALERLASSLSVDVRFVGQRSDIPQILSAFDIFVQSSRYEGFSNALLEAMSVGCACAATAVDGTLDVAKDGENLLLARPSDPQSLALALATLVERPGLKEQLAENAKITAQKFSPQLMIRGFEEAYQRVRSLS